MKKVLIVVLLVIVAGVAGIMRSASKCWGEHRNEMRQSYQLASGGHVEVASINGSVEVQTTDGNTAEVDIITTARGCEDVDNSQVAIEATPESLTIRGGRRDGWGFWKYIWGGRVSQQVVLKVPRQIDLVVKGINGKVTAGGINGSIQIKGVNGQVEAAQSAGTVDVSGVNGGVSVGLDQLNEHGLRVHGVNGGIEIRLGQGVNADLSAHGINGSVHSDASDITVEKEPHGSKFSAHIGAGGPPIDISGVNGGVHLTRNAG